MKLNKFLLYFLKFLSIEPEKDDIKYLEKRKDEILEKLADISRKTVDKLLSKPEEQLSHSREVVSWIQSPRTTNFGSSGEKQYCPDGSFVSGMNLKVEPKQGEGDDTALNAIKLICTTKSGKQVGNITSKEGPWGEYHANHFCTNGFVTGFQLRSENYQGKGDDTAANDLKLKCTNSDGSISEVVSEEVVKFGNFTQEQKCPPKTAVCGILTYIEDNQGGKDDTALNNVDMACCKLCIKSSKAQPTP